MSATIGKREPSDVVVTYDSEQKLARACDLLESRASELANATKSLRSRLDTHARSLKKQGLLSFAESHLLNDTDRKGSR